MSIHGRMIRVGLLLWISSAIISAQRAATPAVAPFRMPPTIGLSGPSIGLSGPSIGLSGQPTGAPHGGVPHVGHSPGSYPNFQPNSQPNSRIDRNRRRQAFPIFAAPYFFDFAGYDSSAGYGSQDQSQPPAVASDNGALGVQVEKLSAKIDDLQNQLAQQPAPVTQVPDAPASPPLTVVLNDGQVLKVQSYAVMNNVFWDFSSERARRIPLSSINVAASAKASEANGSEFPAIHPSS